jgi:CHAT domain-containing protein/tetratricopeptide (TPR) repeat protein
MMLIGKLRWLSLAFCLLYVTAHAQETKLEPGKPVVREITGGETHTYQITLQAAKFVRFRLDQRAIDAALILSAPDGKQLLEMNLTGAGMQESLSLEAAVPGGYRLTVRAAGTVKQRGSYRLEAEMQPSATAQDHKRLTAEALLVEANELSKQRNKTAQQVIEKAQQALLLWQELGEPGWASYSLIRIGNSYSDLGQFGKAIEYSEQALQISREMKDRGGEGNALVGLGIACYFLSRHEKAIEYYEQALVIRRELRNRAGEGGTLGNIGLAYRALSRNEKAIECFEQALVISREIGDRAGEAFALNNLGSANRALSRNEKAIEYFEQALAIRREAKDRAGEGNALNNLGNVYYSVSRYEQAIKYYEQAMAISHEVKDRAGEGNAFNNLAAAYVGMSRYEKAVEYFEQALAIFREVKDRMREGNALNNLGGAHGSMSRQERAIEYYRQALVISREVKDRGGEGMTLTNLGLASSSLSRYEQAIEYHEQGLAVFREVKNRSGEAQALTNLGLAYFSLSRYEKAIEYYTQALAISREVRDRSGEGNALNNLGLSSSFLRRYEQAIEYYTQALAIFREVKNQAGEGSALNSLGYTSRLLSRYEQAVGYLGQALEIKRAVKDRAGEGDPLSNLGAVYAALGRYDKAIEHFEQALLVRREVQDRWGEAFTLREFAKAERNRSNLLAARTHIEESLKVVESLRAEQIVSPESRASFLASVQDSYQLYTDLLMQQHRAEPAKSFDALALEVSERQRSRSLLDLLTEARADVRQGVDAALVERERVLGRQLNDKAQRLIQANNPEQLATLKQDISQLENDYERAQADIRKASPHYAGLTQPRPLKFKEIQQQLDADTLLLEYSLGEDRSYLWAITKGTLTSYELPKGDLIEKGARRVCELLTARSTAKRGESDLQRRERIAQAEADLVAASQSLSQTLLVPVARELANKRLVIVADGALQYIPFAMLPEPKSLESGVGSRESKRNPDARLHTPDPRPPLIAGHEIISLPSASALAIQRSELAGRQLAPKLLAVVADPVFDRTDERFKSPAPETSDNQQARTVASDDARGIEHLADKSDDKSGVTSRRLVIPRLPFTRQEATRLLALTAKDSSFSAMDFQANRATVLKGDLSQYRYVHFATHGVLDSERPGLSSLVLSMVDEEGKPQSGFLRANDIYNLKLPAELVVLSACQTGLGKEIKGEGLVGLTRGFMYAGAARVVVSLWSVNDKATADLMTKFYEKMLKQGERPAAALRAAQVEMWKQRQWQSPYYWAAFTMQGEWR